MAEKRSGNPSVLIPYPGVGGDPDVQDIFVYLRPESNGVLVESVMLKVIQKNPEYKKRIFLVYLANLPGEFIMRNHIIEEHYSLKLKFAVLGKKFFTQAMREAFSRRFGTAFGEAKIVGSFEALRLLSMTPSDLFRRWVPDGDFGIVNGQTIKKIGDMYVVNYDIPALLHMKNREKDIAVMIFRTTLAYGEFRGIVAMMETALVESRILSPGVPACRVFHYSKGPFEQILDGIGYLYTPDAVHIPPEDLPFSRYLMSRSVEFSVIRGILKNPIILYRGADGVLREDNIYSYTQEETFEGAFRKLGTVEAQVVIPD